jgi:superfamily I DNA/RNA helicase
MKRSEIEERLLDRLTDAQKRAVASDKRRVLVVAGAGSGKTEVMARRIAWWVGIEGVPKEKIVAFTFTERAAEEMKFRIRLWLEKITPAGEEVALGGMYIGTIHGFPSSMASRVPQLPLAGKIVRTIDVNGLADNDNNDGERRLMYVALTRAERFLFLSYSSTRVSRFIQGVKKTRTTPAIPGLQQLIAQSGGRVTNDSQALLQELKYAPKEHRRDVRLCPGTFSIITALGFSFLTKRKK